MLIKNRNNYLIIKIFFAAIFIFLNLLLYFY